MRDSLFDKYVNMIKKRAHDYSSKYSIDYSEMESQGFLIYCECLNNFDASKSSFSTYLYTQLSRLNDFALTYRRQKGVLIQDYFEENENFEQIIEARESINFDDFLDDAKKELSENAYNLLLWILNREWEKKYKTKPSILQAMQFFKMTRRKIEKIWEECRMFWINEGYAFYM